MVKYKLIIEYYQKGNNNSQIATLCGCSRTVVWEVLNRFNKIETIFADIQRMSEEELRILLFPERVKKGNGYLIPDFKWEEFQMRKHQSSLRLCWRRYCKRAVKQNLKAYSWASFGLFYIHSPTLSSYFELSALLYHIMIEASEGLRVEVRVSAFSLSPKGSWSHRGKWICREKGGSLHSVKQ